ncbi:MAG: membrane protein insertion efficiency factor YidD [Deltaproteobacteria bacterium]|nr:membrane protein insertion efficiency factor YidD [Deltaproteobacteria bacterium]
MISRSLALLCLFLACSWLNFLPDVSASSFIMKGPKEKAVHSVGSQKIETSCLTIAFFGAIQLYQKRISPVRGIECGFRPSCSHYARISIEEQGPVVGLMMTADRLTRCHIWKEPGPDYPLLPNGKLFDPPSRNLLFDR